MSAVRKHLHKNVSNKLYKQTWNIFKNIDSHLFFILSVFQLVGFKLNISIIMFFFFYKFIYLKYYQIVPTNFQYRTAYSSPRINLNTPEKYTKCNMLITVKYLITKCRNLLNKTFISQSIFTDHITDIQIYSLSRFRSPPL